LGLCGGSRRRTNSVEARVRPDLHRLKETAAFMVSPVSLRSTWRAMSMLVVLAMVALGDEYAANEVLRLPGRR